jgi:hypothetical protein
MRNATGNLLTDRITRLLLELLPPAQAIALGEVEGSG